MHLDVDSRLNTPSSSTTPSHGDASFMQRRSSPSKTKDPDPQLQHTLGSLPFREKSLSLSEGNPRYSNGFSRETTPTAPSRRASKVLTASTHSEGAGVEGVKSSATHACDTPDLINLMSPSPPPPPLTQGEQEVLATSSLTGGNLRPKGSKSAANALWSRRTSEGKEPPVNITTLLDDRTPLTSTSEKQTEPVWKSSFLPTTPQVINYETLTSTAEDSTHNPSSSCSDSEHGSPLRRVVIPSGPLVGEGQHLDTDLLYATPTNYPRRSCDSEDSRYDKLLGVLGAGSRGSHASLLPTTSDDDHTSSSGCSDLAGGNQQQGPLEPEESPLHHHHLTVPPSESPLHHSHVYQHRPINTYEEVVPLLHNEGVASGGGAFFMRPRSHSPDDDNYDHLPGSRGDSPSSSSTSPPLPPSYSVTMDRNISQPVLRSKVPLSPQTSTGRPSNVPESLDEGEEEGGGGGGEGSASSLDVSLGGVVLRSKPKPSDSTPPSTTAPSEEERDPFEELLTRPTAASRLRWSQELNPLYDYFKGAKFTQKMASLDYVLYEDSTQEDHTSSSSTVTSPLIKDDEKASAILEARSHEEEGSGVDDLQDEGGGMTSPLITSQVMGGALLLEEASLSGTLRPRRPHMYEDVALTQGKGDRLSGYVGGVRHQSDVVSSSSSSNNLGAEHVALRHVDSNPAGGVVGDHAHITNPHIGKRQIMLNQRRSRTIGSLDDIATTKRKQKPLKAADNMKVRGGWHWRWGW